MGLLNTDNRISKVDLRAVRIDVDINNIRNDLILMNSIVSASVKADFFVRTRKQYICLYRRNSECCGPQEFDRRHCNSYS